MRALACLLSLALLSGCGKYQPPAGGYRRLQDSAAVVLRFPLLFYSPCLERSGPNESRFIGAERCFTFGKPEHMRGTWAIGFETNQFAQNSNSVSVDLPPGQYRLAGDALPWQQLSCGMDEDACRFRVEFIGRHTKYRMVLGQYVVLVDRLLSMKPVYAAKSPRHPALWVSPRPYFHN